MTSPFNAKIKVEPTPHTGDSDALLNVGPDVKSYIYQAILELEPYTTPDTVITVLAKDPLKLISQDESADPDFDPKSLKTMSRIAISLSEDGGKVEEEGLAEDIFSAVRMAKEKLLKTLADIHDQVISNQERKIQIDLAVGGGHIH